MKRAILLFFVLALCVLGADTFSVQGVLRDPLGKTVDDGYYNLLFKLYNEEAGGSAFWEESQGSVLVTNGVFGVELGVNSPLDQIPFDEHYWIGITVNEGVEMEPRFKLTKSPSAMSVFGTDNVFPSVGNVGIGTHEPAAYLHIVDSEAGVDKLLIESETGENSVVVTEAGKVGINVETPEADLHVVATDAAENKIIIEEADGTNKFVVTAGSQVGVNVEIPEADLHIVATDPQLNKLLIENEDGSSQFVVAPDGKIGVNLDTPAQALDINGNLKMRNGGIMFDDGSTLVSADMGGSASSLSNSGNAMITADSDEDGTGNLDLISGSTTRLSIVPTGTINFYGPLLSNSPVTVSNEIKGTTFKDVDSPYWYVNPAGNSKLVGLSLGHDYDPADILDIRNGGLRIWDGNASVDYAYGQSALYVEDVLELDGNAYISGTLSSSAVYDLQNQNYFVNPAGSSSMQSISLGFSGTNYGSLDVRNDEVRIWDGSATVNYASGAGDLFVEDILECGGYLYASSMMDLDSPSYVVNPSSASKLSSVSIGHNYSPSGCLDVRGNSVRIWDGNASVDYATSVGDLYVEDQIECDGNIRTSGITGSAANFGYVTGTNSVYSTGYIYSDMFFKANNTTSQDLGFTGYYWYRGYDNWQLFMYTDNDFSFRYNGSNKAYVDCGDGSFHTWSDRSVKKNIEQVESDNLGKVMQLKPSRFHYKTQDDSEEKCIGFIAQEVADLYPELVGEKDEELTLNYSGFGVVAIAAIQELNEIVEEQERTIEMLILRIEALENK
ncbi:MAG: tail fiber domain-containing protein [Candidatus Cloacimonetes bacterium]|nr:tail fiber domain-containing protein [Candidatus Cloacimonadota bacterium]